MALLASLCLCGPIAAQEVQQFTLKNGMTLIVKAVGDLMTNNAADAAIVDGWVCVWIEEG